MDGQTDAIKDDFNLTKTLKKKSFSKSEIRTDASCSFSFGTISTSISIKKKKILRAPPTTRECLKCCVRHQVSTAEAEANAAGVE